MIQSSFGILCLFLVNVALFGAQPNVVLVITDDQGYGDLSCFGGEHVDTPRIDQMAAEGMKLTSFYVAAPVCTPSRAALMTGSYAQRVDMGLGSRFGVLLSADSKGLNPDEVTIAEVLKDVGYRTGIFGKWHLGDDYSRKAISSRIHPNRLHAISRRHPYGRLEADTQRNR